jgi:hypothetical protein
MLERRAAAKPAGRPRVGHTVQHSGAAAAARACGDRKRRILTASADAGPG